MKKHKTRLARLLLPLVATLSMGVVTPTWAEDGVEFFRTALSGLQRLDENVQNIKSQGVARWLSDSILEKVDELVPELASDLAPNGGKIYSAGSHVYSIQSKGMETINTWFNEDYETAKQKDDEFWNWLSGEKLRAMVKDVVPDRARIVANQIENIAAGAAWIADRGEILQKNLQWITDAEYKNHDGGLNLEPSALETNPTVNAIAFAKIATQPQNYYQTVTDSVSTKISLLPHKSSLETDEVTADIMTVPDFSEKIGYWPYERSRDEIQIMAIEFEATYDLLQNISDVCALNLLEHSAKQRAKLDEHMRRSNTDSKDRDWDVKCYRDVLDAVAFQNMLLQLSGSFCANPQPAEDRSFLDQLFDPERPDLSSSEELEKLEAIANLNKGDLDNCINELYDDAKNRRAVMEKDRSEWESWYNQPRRNSEGAKGNTGSSSARRNTSDVRCEKIDAIELLSDIDDKLRDLERGYNPFDSLCSFNKYEEEKAEVADAILAECEQSPDVRRLRSSAQRHITSAYEGKHNMCYRDKLNTPYEWSR